MERAAELLNNIRTRMGITIVWVEHIMGVLMRIVDRVIVLDHGEKIFEGVPGQAAVDPRVTEVISARKKHSAMLSLTSVSAATDPSRLCSGSPWRCRKAKRWA